jgi:type III secretion protein Q
MTPKTLACLKWQPPHEQDCLMDAMTLATAQPAILPRLTANQARALSLIATHGADFAFTLPPAEGADAATGMWRLGLTYGAPDALRQAASYRTDLEWAGVAVRLHLPPAALTAWINARVPDLAPGELPPALRAAALETLLAEAIAALGPMSSGGPPRVIAEANAARLSHAWTLAVRAHATGDTVLAVLETDDLGLMLLAGLINQAPAPANRDIDIDSIPVRLRAEVGAAVLPAAALRALVSGDVVLLDEYLVSSQGELWLGVPSGQGVRVRAEQSSYLVTQSWTTLMTQNLTTAEHAPDGEPLDPDAIPVRLTFDLGERSMTLAEVSKLQSGVIFDLQRPLADGAVMIRANGALIGSGALVEVDGRTGVCIGTLGKGGA